DDLIRAVNNALNGCSEATPTSGTPPTATRTPTPTRKPTNTRKPTATPTQAGRCPSTFSTSGNNLCLFNGTYNRSCGSALNATFSSNGSVIDITIATNLVDTPTVRFSANVTSATAANLTVWSSDNFQTSRLVTGIVTLNSNGQQLVIFPDNSPFMIQGCSFVQYLGAYQSSRSAGTAAADENGFVIPDLADQ
ncbi:MAG TPA: hypothetical protein VL049_19425, partial [Candidatus Dormibacteraeota bacterium]|nr:hypothetical protein [Candidatus Dormibacteraeota bacterium]